MITYPNIDPVIFSLGPLQVRWYGLMYVLGFGSAYFLVKRQIKQFDLKKLEIHFENLNFILILCLIGGARLGYVLFYNLSYYLDHPLEIFATWQGGMSFHGGMLALILGGWLFCKIKGLDFWQTADLYSVTAPIGLGLGRIGNFINGELYGRATNVPWAMIFPNGGLELRHPSQLYESLLEGVFLFVILWKLKNKRYPSGTILSFFLIFYGIFRCVAEIFREPDAHIGFILGLLTMGQILSALMILVGIILFIFKNKRSSI